MQNNQYQQQQNGKAIPFISINTENNKTTFELNRECYSVFEKIRNKEISVLSIAGPQRTGKSFLANRILKKMKGFAIGPTTMPCTKGIWMWSEAIELDENRVMIIIDTEGLYSVQRDANIDMKIFSLSILLSSMFVYNQIGHIDENSLEQLSLVLNLNQSIKIDHQQDSLASEEQIQTLCPHFVWVLRDFSLDLQGLSSKEYLQRVLTQVQGNQEEKAQKNQIREKIRTYFKKIDCITLVRPLGNEQQLANIEDQEWNNLRVQFREGVIEFERKVLREIKVKEFDRQVMNGEMYLKMVQQFVKSINSKGIPELKGSLENVMNSQLRQVMEALQKQFDSNYNQYLNNSQLPMQVQAIQSLHAKLVTYIHQQVESKSAIFLNLNLKQILINQIDKYMETQLNDILVRNNAISNTNSTSQMYNLLNNFYPQQFSSLQDLQSNWVQQKAKEFDILYNAYITSTQSSNKYQLIADKIPPLLFSFIEKSIENIYSLFQQHLKNTEIQLKQSQDTENRLRNSVNEFEELFNKQQKEKENLRKQIEILRKENQELQEKQFKQIEQDLEQNIQLDNIKGDSKDIQKYILQQSEYEFQIQELKQINQQLVNKNRNYQKQLEEMKNYQNKQLDQQVDEELIEIIEELKYQVKQLEQYKQENEGGFFQQFIKKQTSEIDQLKEQIKKEKDKYEQKSKDKIKQIEIKMNQQQQLANKKIEILYSSNDELKLELISYQQQVNQYQAILNKSNLQEKEISQLNQLISSKTQHQDSQNNVLNQLNKEINSHVSEKQILEQKLAKTMAEKALLSSTKDTFYDILKESLKFVKNKNNHLKSSLRNLLDQDKQEVFMCFEELGIKL